jgi:hypothetical protein
VAAVFISSQGDEYIVRVLIVLVDEMVKVLVLCTRAKAKHYFLTQAKTLFESAKESFLLDLDWDRFAHLIQLVETLDFFEGAELRVAVFDLETVAKRVVPQETLLPTHWDIADCNVIGHSAPNVELSFHLEVHHMDSLAEAVDVRL